jgi:uncharacterized protein
VKLLLVVALVLLVVWYWRRPRAPGASAPPPGSSAQAAAQTMLPCAVCAVHVARGEAVVGTKGVYCCAEHLRQAEAP